MNNNSINLSVIIPVYNAGDYLIACLDSLKYQGNLQLEVIIINDGSTDHSGAIADNYANNDNRIKVIHQEHCGRGGNAANNIGLTLAQGEYVAFLDHDDWVKENSLFELYREAIKHQADVVKGNAWFYKQDGTLYNSYDPFPDHLMNIPLSGKECFVHLVKTNAYAPMAWNYIYRKVFLRKIQARFVEGIIGDAIWSPIVISQAEKMVVVDVDFYYYRQWDGSYINSLKLYQRLDGYFQVTEHLMEFSERFSFSEKDGEFKSWWYVNVFVIYLMAFEILAKVKDSSYVVPKHHLDRFWRDCWEMAPEPQKICINYFRYIEVNFKKYTDWRISEWVASVACQLKTGKKLMLIYNTIQGKNLSLKIEDVPADWVVTTDRRYVNQADTVVFYLPDTYQELKYELKKPEGQIWAAWHLETEKNDSQFEDMKIKDNIDLWLNYSENDVQNEHPLVSLCRNISNETNHSTHSSKHKNQNGK